MGAFLCLCGTCYIYLSLPRRVCGLLAAVRSSATRYPRKRESLDRLTVNINRSATELMAIDRKPEFFKGAQLKVGIIGCGYVGLPLALRFAEAGHRVTGFDTDPNKVTMLNAGKSYIEHIPQNKIQQFVNSRHFSASNDFAKVKEADAILICVPTPLDERREPDLSYVEQTAISIYPHLQKGQLVVLESTTYPGTTEERLLPILE